MSAWRRWQNLAIAAWFVFNGVFFVGFLLRDARGLFGADTRVYDAATNAWLSGSDPWRVAVDGVAFAAPPPTLLLMLPTLPLGDVGAALVWSIGSLLLAVWTVRRLRLPWYWLAFAPLWEAVWTGNPDVLVIAALVAGVGPVAVVAKVYAAVPLLLLGRWRELAVTALVLAATALILPWGTFVDDLGVVRANLASQSAGGISASAYPVLIAPTILALISLGRRRAAWLAVPALWPDAQAHYALIGLPAAGPVLGLFWAAVFLPAVFPIGVIAAAIAALAERRRAPQTSPRATASRAAPLTG